MKTQQCDTLVLGEAETIAVCDTKFQFFLQNMLGENPRKPRAILTVPSFDLLGSDTTTLRFVQDDIQRAIDWHGIKNVMVVGCWQNSPMRVNSAMDLVRRDARLKDLNFIPIPIRKDFPKCTRPLILCCPNAMMSHFKPIGLLHKIRDYHCCEALKKKLPIVLAAHGYSGVTGIVARETRDSEMFKAWLTTFVGKVNEVTMVGHIGCVINDGKDVCDAGPLETDLFRARNVLQSVFDPQTVPIRAITVEVSEGENKELSPPTPTWNLKTRVLISG